MAMSSIFVQTSFAVSKNSQQVTPWKTTRRIDIQVAGRDIPNQVARNMKVNSLKLRNPKSFLTSIDSFGTVEKPFSKYRSLDEKHSNSAATIPEHEAAIIPEEEHPFSFQNSITKKFDLLQRFCRPLAIVGTAVGTSSIALLSLETISEISPRLIIGVLQAVASVGLMDAYMNGINQLFDFGIDKVNKPYLPLVSGEMSLQTGAAIVAITSFMAIVMGIMIQSPPLLSVILFFFFFGGAYSINLPFLRWKNNAFLAASCIMFLKGLVFQIGIFVHIQKYVLGKPIAFTRSLVFAAKFMSMFSVALAILKDIPDHDGDKAFGVKSLALLLGKEWAFWLGTFLIMMAYGAAIVTGASTTFLYSKLVTVLGHGALASIFWLRARSIDLSDDKSTHAFFVFAGKLYFAEYFLIPFVR